MRDVVLKDEASQLLERDKNAFRARCGDEFVSGFITGGEYHAIIEIQTHSQEERQAIAASASASFGIFSGSGSFSSSLEKLAASNRLQVYVYSSGGSGQVISIQPDAMIKQATEFARVVEEFGARRIAALTQSYRTLDLPNTASVVVFRNQLSVLRELSDIEGRVSTFLANMDYALANPTEFIDFSPKDANEAARVARNDLNLIRTAANQCYENVLECSLPEGKELDLSQLKLPVRVSSNAEACADPIFGRKLTRSAVPRPSHWAVVRFAVWKATGFPEARFAVRRVISSHGVRLVVWRRTI